MTPTIIPDLLSAAEAVRSAVAVAFAGHPAEDAANAAVAAGSPALALGEGLVALWAVAPTLDLDGVNALASAAHHVATHGFLWRGGLAAAVLVAIALAESPAALTGGPPRDPTFSGEPEPELAP